MHRTKLREAIQSDSLTNQVYVLLQQQIASGALKPGERILEKELAHALGISRTPVREALLKLETDRMVVLNSRRSYNVRVLTIGDVREIFETCGVLESEVARSVADKLTDEDIDLLKRYNRELAAAAKGDDMRAFGNCNHKFHEVFLARHGNRAILEVCSALRKQLYTFPVRRNTLPESQKKSVREHREIIRLAAARDGGALAAYFRDVHWSFDKNRRYLTDIFDHPDAGTDATGADEAAA